MLPLPFDEISLHSKCVLSSPVPKPKPPKPSPNPVKPSQISSKGTGADTKILGNPTHPITFRSPVWDYMVQVEASSTPECQDSVPSHPRCSVRGRTWGIKESY